MKWPNDPGLLEAIADVVGMALSAALAIVLVTAVWWLLGLL